MRCKNCGFENPDSAKFCVDCGASLVKCCPRCRAAVDDGVKFCPTCGARCDGKLVCPRCRTVNEGNARHCVQCGTPLLGPQPIPGPVPGKAPVPPAGPIGQGAPPVPPAHPAAGQAAAPVPPGVPFAQGVPPVHPAPVYTYVPVMKRVRDREQTKALAFKIADLVRASLVAAFAIIMFTLSFFSVCKLPSISMPSGSGSAVELPVSVNLSSIDIIGGAFARIKPKPLKQVSADLLQYAQEKLNSEDYADFNRFLSGGDSEKGAKAAARIFSHYNPLKLLAAKEVVDLTPSVTMDLAIYAVMAFAYIGVTAAMLVMSILSLVYLVTGRRKGVRATTKLGIACAFVALGFYSVLNASLEPDAMGYGAVCMLIFGLLSAAFNVLYSLAKRELTFERGRMLKYISAGVSAAILIVLLILSVGSLTSVKYVVELEDVTLRYTLHYSASDLGISWSALKMLDQGLMKAGEGAVYFEQIAANIGNFAKTDLEGVLSPGFMGVLGKYVGGENALVALGLIAIVLNISLIGVLAAAFGAHLGDAADGKVRERIGFPIAIYALLVCNVIVSAVYAALVNNTTAELDVNYKAYVSAILITAASFGMANLIRAIVIKIIDRSRDSYVPVSPEGFVPDTAQAGFVPPAAPFAHTGNVPPAAPFAQPGNVPPAAPAQPFGQPVSAPPVTENTAGAGETPVAAPPPPALDPSAPAEPAAEKTASASSRKKQGGEPKPFNR